MRFKKYFPRPASLLVAFAALWAAGFACGQSEPYRLGKYFWPTSNPAFVRGESDVHVLQPTQSGNIESARFGCVRNGGRRFHEGVDLKATQRDRSGEPADAIYAFDYGVVRYVNRSSGSSSFGNYVVIEHPRISSGFVSIYAHLSDIPESVHAGLEVLGGQRIATMGRTSSATRIPRNRAHLHFEVGLWLGADFQVWFDRQPFGSSNEHEAYNGMNIVGIDVWKLLGELRSGSVENVWDFLRSEPVAVITTVRTGDLPAIMKGNPRLQRNISTPGDRAGWRIYWTSYGAPIAFEALRADEFPADASWLEMEVPDPDRLRSEGCVDMVEAGPDAGPGKKLSGLINRMFLDH